MKPAIEVKTLGIRYNLRLTRKNTVRESFKNLASRRDGPTHFWALRDVSFRIDHGESLAVIGPNGAGKSTLLQVLAKILMPTEGYIEVNGRISSLLTLGAGFDPDLSGRDNILLAGAFMGMSHEDMTRRLPGIIEFADIGQFIDAPIKTYSSGMNARLGFSIATAVEPDVLLLDEVLGTGDATFRLKSQTRVEELMKSARAIVLVTHDMRWPVDFCNRAILLERGHIVAAGDPAGVVAIHEERSAIRRAGEQPEPLPAITDNDWIVRKPEPVEPEPMEKRARAS
ncbi:MAG TPA: ABC transporter ATP-binding protein [Candidatus Limnocylindrales bacterium]